MMVYSYFIFRTARWNGLAQAVNLRSGEIYKITAYVKLLNTANDAAFQTVGIMEKCDVAGNLPTIPSYKLTADLQLYQNKSYR